MKNIVLLGFMGTGKTGVGRQLAQDLGREFVEMDALIEEREKTTINDIFAEKGEAYFRALECEIARQLAARQGLVVSAGGGVVLNRSNVQALEESGILICLQAAPEEIYRRVVRETQRPLLRGSDPLAKIKALLDFRKPYYDKIKLQLDTTGKSIQQVVEEIKRLIR